MPLQDLNFGPDLGFKEPVQSHVAGLPQCCSSSLALGLGHCRHACRWSARTLGVGKNMEMGQAEPVNSSERVGEHSLGLGWETGNDIGTKHDIRASLAGAMDLAQTWAVPRRPMWSQEEPC